MKTLISAKHPKTQEQYIDAFLDEYENIPCQELGFLVQLFHEQGWTYSFCDLNRICNLRANERDLERFERSLTQKKPQTLQEVDSMTGFEFEDYIITLFLELGYHVERSPRGDEQGMDFLLERHGEKTACQLKRYKKPVGNRAIQEVIAARDYYGCEKALVITNSSFTASARRLAGRCGVELWDRKKLKELLKKRR